MDYIKGFRQELLQQGKSRHTINNYLQAVLEYKSYVQNRYAVDFSAELMSEENVEYFREYLFYITMPNPAAINSKLSALGSFAEYLTAQGLLNDNPVKRVKRVKRIPSSSHIRRELTGEILVLRETVHKHKVPRDIAIFELLLDTGIKVSELCALEIGDIDLKTSSAQLIIRQGQKRVISLNQLAVDALKAYLRVRPAVGSPILFQGQRGSLRREAIYRIIDKYAREAKVKICPQDLRDQFCQELIKQKDLNRAAQLAGYSSSNQLRRKIRNNYYTT
jgi:site-specific recombinase XerD